MLEELGYGVHITSGRMGPINVPGVGEEKVILEERHFRRMDKFSGEEGKWAFNLLVAMGGIDQSLADKMQAVMDKKMQHVTE